MDVRPTLETEARRLFLRYAEEVVEAMAFCPWARDARLAGRVRVEVRIGETPDVAQTLAAIESIEADRGLDIGILVFPEITLDRVAFRHFAADVRAAYAARARNEDARMAIADFHPDVEPDLGSADRLVAFVRSSPDPVLQLVRERALASVRKAPDVGTRFFDPETLGDVTATSVVPGEAVSDRVARANLRTVQRLGLAQVRGIVDDIHADRDRSYAALGLPPRPWSRVGAGLHTT